MKFSFFSNLSRERFLSKMRQPWRALHSDLSKESWTDVLKELLRTRNLMLERCVAGVRMVMPTWEHCFECEYQLSKEAIRLTWSKVFPIFRALWAACQDEHHRMEHCVTLLTIASGSSLS